MNNLKSLIFLLTIISFNSNAEIEQEKIGIANHLSTDQFCFKAGEIATKFMEMRQNGNSISRALQLSNILSLGKEQAYLVFKHFTIKAYEQPIEKTKIDSEKSIREFNNTIIIECLKEVGEDQEIKVYQKDSLPDNWNTLKERILEDQEDGKNEDL